MASTSRHAVAHAALAATIALATLAAPATLRAVTLRYAVIIGNNHGLDAEGRPPYAPLQHAEREAQVLHEKLVELGNFDPDPRRTALLLGATRAQVQESVEALVAQKKADEVALGEADTMFAFFFTGHGQTGQLLLNDGPLSQEELGEVFRLVDADFNIGVFDACNSGSLDPDVLAEKGFKPTPGLNLFRALPEEILNSTGSVWFVSSGPEQVSYEDKQLGGVFTHFFIEGMERAQRDGPGITLERIWHYAREHTVEYTAARQRHQEPQQYVAKLKTRGPLYFSFPGERSATLVLAESVEGTFVLSYADGQLTEMFEKAAGQRQELAVYPGSAWLLFLRQGQVYVQEKVRLQANERLVLRGNPDPQPPAAFGDTRLDLWEKGLGDRTLAATLLRPGRAGLLLDAGYALQGAPGTNPLLLHRLDAGLRLTYAGFVAGARLGYGYSEQRFDSWGYQAHGALGGLWGGWGQRLGWVQLHGALRLDGGYLLKRFDSPAAERGGWLLAPGAELRAGFPAGSLLAGEAWLGAGGQLAPVPQDEQGYAFSPYVGGGLALLIELL